jgi:hypothetical protein
MSRSGRVQFTAGEARTFIDVPLIDNGLVDGPKAFTVLLTNASSSKWKLSQEVIWVVILDNELGPAVDPLFVPDVAAARPPPYHYFGPAFIGPTLDGSVLVSGLRGLCLLDSKGLVDPSFTPESNAGLVDFGPLQVLTDGRILGVVGATYVRPQLARVWPNGHLEMLFNLTNFTGFAFGLTDGKVLVLVTNTPGEAVLRRLSADGSEDPGFSPVTVPPHLPNSRIAFAQQADGKIVLGGDLNRNGLVRLNPGGGVDGGFNPPGIVRHFLLRANGKLIIRTDADVLELNDDGTIAHALHNDGDLFPSDCLAEVPGGRLLDVQTSMDFGQVNWWHEDGTSEPVARLRGNFHPSCGGVVTPSIVADSAGGILIAGAFTEVDGFPRRGLARLLANPPDRDFRVMTPAEFCRSTGIARLRIVRTGVTTNFASVSFGTRDATARAGLDYLPLSGTLEFAPLEVSKPIGVRLLPRMDAASRVFFELTLTNASPGYSTVTSTPIAILPDLRIETDSLRPQANGAVAITVSGTLPGIAYTLEASKDLQHWFSTTGPRVATGPAVVFSPVYGVEAALPPWRAPQFFRGSRD